MRENSPSRLNLIDTHTHLDFPDFDNDREQVMARAHAAGVERIVIVGVQRQHWERLWSLVKHTEGLYAALGLHPMFLQHHHHLDISHLENQLTRLSAPPELCAIGECGLDYSIPNLDREQQQTLLEAQLNLARGLNLPVLLHVRRAHARMIATLKAYALPRAGIIHAFSGSYEEAREYLKLGFKLGLGGAATWPRALRLQATLNRLPVDAWVLETDSPDMAPAMYARQRNEPAHLDAICTHLATIMHTDATTLAHTTTANACQIFGWDAKEGSQAVRI